ncbi:MAG: MBL fold metallo-hydrolase [Clostridia bacterium]|nr:MBL fold metallo-hydrolase [Clostridia bacterium]
MLKRLAVGPVQANCYILSAPGRDDCAVIDPGGEAGRIRAACGGRKIAAILLTHGHFDHTGAVDALCEPGTEVWIHEADAPMLTDPLLNAGWLLGDEMTVAHPAHTFRGGDTIEAAGLRFTVHHTPGHTPGGVCFEVEDLLFTGDTVMNGGIGRTDLPGGSEKQLQASLRKLNPLLRTRRILGGHG